MEFKINIGDPKTKKTYKKELKEDDCKQLIGKRIGDVIKGELLELPGYELEITGGSDFCGFPMRKDVQGGRRKKILAVQGIGVKKKGKGIRQRKTVAGNTIYPKTAQINLKVVKHGKGPIAAPAEEPAGEAPATKDEAPAKAVAEKSEKPAKKPVEKKDAKKK